MGMKQITNQEYEEFQKYKSDKLHGHILTPEGLRFIIEANEYMHMHFTSGGMHGHSRATPIVTGVSQGGSKGASLPE